MPKPNGVRFRLDHRFAGANLSTYIDGRLEARERERVERHLAVCPSCREGVLSLRQTVSMLRDLPPRPLPRSFALPASERAAQVRHRRWDVAFGALRSATLVTATLLVLLVSGDALLSAALTGQPVPLVAGDVAPAAEPAPEALMAPAAPASEEIPAGEEDPAATTEMFSLQAPAPAPADEPSQAPEAGVSGVPPEEGTGGELLAADAVPPPEGTPAPEGTLPAGAAPNGETYTAAAETPVAPPASGEEGFVPPPAPPGMGGGGRGVGGVGGAGAPEAIVPPTTGPEVGVAAAGATGDSSAGGVPAEPGATEPAATEPVDPEATADPEAGSQDGASAAADAAPAPEEGPVVGIAAVPAEPEPSAPSEPPAVARGMGGVPVSPEPTVPADRVAARIPDEATQEEPGVTDTARIYGLEARQAVDAWQVVRIGAALMFGLLLVLLSGLVWSGYQRRL